VKSIVNKLKDAWWLLPAITMLLLSQFDWDYSYYELLRVVVCFSSLFIVYRYRSALESKTAIFLYTGIAVLFNPFIPIHLDRSAWAIIDFGTAFIFLREFFSKD
jgi:hypothetical protein